MPPLRANLPVRIAENGFNPVAKSKPKAGTGSQPHVKALCNLVVFEANHTSGTLLTLWCFLR